MTAARDEFVNIDQARAILLVSRATLYRMIGRREIAHYKRGGQSGKRGARVYFKRRDLERFVEMTRVEAV